MRGGRSSGGHRRIADEIRPEVAISAQHMPRHDIMREEQEQLPEVQLALMETFHKFGGARQQIPVKGCMLFQSRKAGGAEDFFLVMEMLHDVGGKSLDMLAQFFG